LKVIEKADISVLQGIMDKNLSLGYDWRDQDKVARVYDQGDCQSSWAFTTSSTLTSAMAIQNNQSATDL
jgi:C1A family cysteine protease